MNTKQFPIREKEAGQRLDLFLKDKLKISRKKAKQLIDSGQIFNKDKRIIIASWELQKGDQIKVLDSKSAEEAQVPRSNRYLKIHFEDKHLLVVEKPAGVACEKSLQSTSSTLVDDINDYLRRSGQSEDGKVYLGLMHRLDKETSGLMVYSKSTKGNHLSEQFKNHSIQRRYLALVLGTIPKESGRIKAAIGPDPEKKGRQQITKGRPAITDYQVIERYAHHTFIEASLLTGKTHQVRVHLAHLGYPILGDRLYGKKSSYKRQMLHASHLQFLHPVNKKKMSFDSEVPPDMLKLIDRFRS